MRAAVWQPNDEELQSFLDATTESGARVRQVLIVTAVASVIMLSTQQVLSVPQTTPDGERDQRPAHGAPLIFFSLPVIVQLGAVLNDLFSFDVVTKGPSPLIHAILQTLVVVAFLWTLIILARDCGRLRVDWRRIWEEYFARLSTTPGS